MNAAIHVIGVDIGTQSTKAVLVRADGHIVAQASINYQVETPKPLWPQQWPGVWLYAVAASICGVLAEAGVDAASVKSLCVSSLYGGSIDPHALLERDAAPLPLGADGLLFLPYLMGECSPVWDAQASGCFIGLGLHHGRAHLYRAVLEGVSMALRHNIEAGVRGVAKLDDHLVVVGGASHSDLWMQIIADVTGRSVAVDVRAILAALRSVYAAPRIADELQNGR